MAKKKVGVVRGGRGGEYDVSLKTGANVLKNMPKQYEGIDVLLTKDGTLHIHGAPVTLEELMHSVDVVWNALHGEYGEDGQFQRELNRAGILYTGSDAIPSALSMDKTRAKEVLTTAGIKMPAHIVLEKDGTAPEKLALELFRTFPQPSVVKPLANGSSVGVSLARTHQELARALVRAFAVSPVVIVEEYISGKEATVGVIDQYRGESLYALPPVEIRLPADKELFDYEAKYTGIADEIAPGNFSQKEKDELLDIARTAHAALGLRHYSRSDMIVSPRGIYFLEVNTLPGLTEHSLLPKALSSVGSNLPEFLDHVILLALARS